MEHMVCWHFQCKISRIGTKITGNNADVFFNDTSTAFDDQTKNKQTNSGQKKSKRHVECFSTYLKHKKKSCATSWRSRSALLLWNLYHSRWKHGDATMLDLQLETFEFNVKSFIENVSLNAVVWSNISWLILRIYYYFFIVHIFFTFCRIKANTLY